MNTYRTRTTCSIYGTQIFLTKAHTPYDACEKAENKLSWRAKEDILKVEVMILDGTKQTWTFEAIREK